MLRERRAAHGCVRTRRSARRSPIVIAAAEAAVTAVVRHCHAEAREATRPLLVCAACPTLCSRLSGRLRLWVEGANCMRKAHPPTRTHTHHHSFFPI